MGIINKLTQLTINKHIFLIMYNIMEQKLEVDQNKIKTFDNFKYPLDDLHSQVMIACVCAKSMGGKSFMVLELINLIKNNDKMGIIVCGATPEKSPVYSTIKEYFGDKCVFLPEYEDDILDNVKKLIESPPFKDFDHNCVIVDDIIGLSSARLKKKLDEMITSWRHYSVHMIFQIQSIKNASIPKSFRSNANILCISSKSNNDLEELTKLSQIDKTRLKSAVEESNKHQYSFIVWNVATDYYLVYSNIDGWI